MAHRRRFNRSNSDPRRAIARRLRGHGGPVAFLAVVGILGVVSGFALADPDFRAAGGNPPQPCGDGTATRINEPTSGLSTNVVVIGGATLTFVFDNDPDGPFSATWTADAPFTGTILVKAGSEAAGGGETTFTFSNALSGTVYSPFTNQNGKTLAISHVDTCGTGSTTTHTLDTTVTLTSNSTTTTTLPNTTSTVTLPPSTVTTTLPNTTTSTTLPNSTTTTTAPGTTTTVSLPNTTTTTTGPGSTVTTTIPCGNQVQNQSLTTITVPGTTNTVTQPGNTVTTTNPGSTNTVTQTGQTITLTIPGNTQTVTEPGETDTITNPGSTIVSTVPGQNSTVTECTTTSSTSSTPVTTTAGSVAGTTTAGGASGGGAAGTKKAGGNGNGNGESAASSATEATGGLPFTGYHAPMLVLAGLLMAAAGLVLRRTVGRLE